MQVSILWTIHHISTYSPDLDISKTEGEAANNFNSDGGVMRAVEEFICDQDPE